MTYGDGDYAYELVDDWATLPAGESFLDVGSVCVDGEDRVLVLNRSDRPLMIFDRSGERVDWWMNDGLSGRPHGMGLDAAGNVYCADDGRHTVTKLSPGGDPLLTLGTPWEPSETGFRDAPDLFERLASITRGGKPFNQPTDAAVTDDGEIYVADGYGNARVHRFDADGELLGSWGGPGAGAGEFRLPHSITVGPEGRVWVTDRENSRIQVFDADGEFLEEWTDVFRPTDLAIVDGAVFVSELCRRVSVYTLDGELLTRWGNADHDGTEPLFLAPHTIAVDPRGDVYVGEVSYAYQNVDRGARTVRKFRHVS
jgi:DNA-binding beta-propeller fold protein YncE